MSDEVRLLREATNQKIEELNGFLAEADVEPVTQLNEWAYDSPTRASEAGLWIQQRKQRIDMLSLPEYVDARAHTTVHQILGFLQQLEDAHAAHMESLEAEL